MDSLRFFLFESRRPKMTKIFSLVATVFLVCFMISPAPASSDLDVFVSNLNVQAQADIGAFKVRLSTQFGIPVPKIDALMVKVATPGDLYMRVGQVASQPVDTVLREYQANKGKGWGVIAKNLGIKPGSKEFHALKAGGLNGEDSGKGKGKGKGRGKGH